MWIKRVGQASNLGDTTAQLFVTLNKHRKGVVELYKSNIEILSIIKERGHLFDTTDAALLTDDVGYCHHNSINRYQDGQGQYEIATGWAYYGGGWIQHSWLVNKKGRLIETCGSSSHLDMITKQQVESQGTVNEAYYGAVLTKYEVGLLMKVYNMA
jgi:hypothetical protein